MTGPGESARRTLKCTVLLFVATMLLMLGGDAAKSLTAAALGIPNTLFHYATVYERPARAESEIVLIYLATVALDLVAGLLAAWTVARARSAAAQYFALYLAATASAGVFGALMAVPWGGDLNAVAAVLAVPMPLQVTLAITGGLLFLVVLWQIGLRIQPPVGALVVPLAASLAVRLLVYTPAPAGIYLTMVMGSAHWVVIAAGSVWHARTSRAPAAIATSPLRVPAFVWSAALLLAVLVQWLRTGVRFG